MAGTLWQVPAYYVMISIATFVVYWLDKSAAQAGRWRIPESRLHLLGVVGGWPGALIAQRCLHHKTHKQPFQIIFWITVVLHFGALAWICAPHARHFLESLMQ